jgi:hypothetical protein
MSVTEEAPKATTTNRAEGARLPKAGGPGSSCAERVAHLRAVMIERVSDEDLARIIDKLVELAAAGNLAAIRLVLKHVFGKPAGPVPDAAATIKANAVKPGASAAEPTPVQPATTPTRQLTPRPDTLLTEIGARIRDQVFEERSGAAVTKRETTARSATINAPPVAATETLRLIDPTPADPARADRRDAHRRRP